MILFQCWNEVVFSTSKYCYHNFTSIGSYPKNWFWCQPRFNVASALTSMLNQSWQCDVNSTLISLRPTSTLTWTLNQRWQYDIDSILTSRRPMSHSCFSNFVWNNVACLLGKPRSFQTTRVIETGLSDFTKWLYFS